MVLWWGAKIMVQHIVTDPQGVRHIINAPEDATPEQVISFAQQHMGAPAAEGDGFLSRVGQDLFKRGETAARYAQELQTGKKSVPEFIGKTVANVGAGAINDIIGEGIVSAASMAPDFIKEPVKTGLRNIAETPVGKAVGSGVEKYREFANQNPRSAEWLSALGNVSTLPAVGKGVDIAADATGSAALKAGDALYESGKKTFDNRRLNFIKELALPEETQKVLESRAGKSPVKGFLRAKTYEPTRREQEIIDEVAKTSVSPKKTIEENLSVLDMEARKEGDKLYDSLQKLGITYDARELANRLDETMKGLEKNPRVVESRQVAETIIDKAKSIIGSGNKDISSALRARQELDKWITSLGRESAFDPKQENALSATLRSTRQSINDFINEKATPPSASKYSEVAGDVQYAINEYEKLKDIEAVLINAVENKAQLSAKQSGFWKGRSITEAAKEAKNLANIQKQIRTQEKTISSLEEQLKNFSPRGVNVADSLRKQHLLLSAIDNLRPKAGKEARTAIGRAAQRVYNAAPLKSDLGKLASGLAITGGGIGLVSALPAAATTGALGYGAYKGATSPSVRMGVGRALRTTGRNLKGGKSK